MPSSRSSLDKRDIYYRLHKSAGYRARSAYKLIHLDEEFDLFTGVRTVVDLCAAPGSWSQVVGERLGPRLASGQAKLVSLDLQPMAPLRHTTTVQADLTTPCTIPLVLSHLDNRKADLVICDGAPDVTGVHDLDAYLHHQLLMAAFTLTLAILQKGGTAVYKIFLSPLDPQAAGLREQIRVFFPGEEDKGGWFEEYDDEEEEGEEGGEMGGKKGFGGDMEGRRGGVWVRKPRSSRKGSGEAFLVCRNYDPSTVPLPLTFSPTALAALAQQTTGTLTLDSLAHLAGTDVKLSAEQTRRWEILKGWVGKGDLNPMSTLTSSTKTPDSKRDALEIDTTVAPPLTPPAPSSPTITHTEPTPGASTSGRTGPLSLTLPSMSHLSPPRSTPSYAQHRRNRSSIDSGSPSSPTSAAWAGGWGGLGPSPLPSPVSPYPPNLPADETGRASISGLSRSSSIKHEPYALSRYVDPPHQQPRPDSDGMISPALSTSSRTDMFFASSQIDFLPTPPRPLSGSSSTTPGGSGTGSLGRAGSLGKGWPGRSLLSQSITSQADLGGPGKTGERDRASTMPTTPINGGTTPTRPGDDGWALSPKGLEAVSAPSVSQNVGIGIGVGIGHTRDRRLSGTGRVASLSGSDTLGLGKHSRDRSDSAASSINPGDRILTSPLTGLPSGDSIRALANLVGSNATSSALDPPPTISRAQLTKNWARRESLIEREEHRTHEHQEGGLQPGEVLVPVEKEELGRMEEEDDEWTPDRERREEVMGSFSGAWPGSSRGSGMGGVGGKRRWRLEKKLGEGAFSAVWGARAEVDDNPTSPKSSTLAAIKLLPRQLTASNDRTRISFLREVGVLSRLSHPHIVGFIDDFETRTYFCLALERVEGGELFEVIQDKKWVGVLRECRGIGARRDAQEVDREKGEQVDGEVLVRRVFSELVRATTFLHACGVVHRDIKLENILLTVNPLIHLPPQPTMSNLLSALPPPSKPLIKLTDFGLSRFISPSSPLLTTRCGSESFAAPEIIMGKPYDGRDTDSWACGVVLYATITGELPFDTGSTSPTAPTGGSGFSIGVDSEKEERRRRMLRIAKGAYSWPSGMGSEGARKVVGRLLVRDPRKRARVADLWDEDWMKGMGAVGPEKDEEGDTEDGKKRVKGGWVIQGGEGDEMVTEGGF